MKSKDSENTTKQENEESASSEKNVEITVEKVKPPVNIDGDTSEQKNEAIVAEFKTRDDENVTLSLEKKATSTANDSVRNTVNEFISDSASPVANISKKAGTMENKSSTNITTNDGSYEEWVVMPDSAWPPPIFIKKNAPPRERFYLEKRWYSQWSYYDSKATENKDTYFLYQRIVVIGALIIPALVSINSTLARFLAGVFNNGDVTAEAMWRIGVDSITVIVSLLVAGAAALESLYKYGENWSSYRSAAEELQAEKNFYDMQSGPYANNPNPFSTFVERVEGIVANQNGKYFQAVQQQLQKQSDDNENIVASFRAGDEGDDEYELSVQSSPTQPVDVG